MLAERSSSTRACHGSPTPGRQNSHSPPSPDRPHSDRGTVGSRPAARFRIGARSWSMVMSRSSAAARRSPRGEVGRPTRRPCTHVASEAELECRRRVCASGARITPPARWRAGDMMNAPSVRRCPETSTATAPWCSMWVREANGRRTAERLLPVARTAGSTRSDRSFGRLVAGVERLVGSEMARHQGRLAKSGRDVGERSRCAPVRTGVRVRCWPGLVSVVRVARIRRQRRRGGAHR